MHLGSSISYAFTLLDKENKENEREEKEEEEDDEDAWSFAKSFPSEVKERVPEFLARAYKRDNHKNQKNDKSA